MTQDNCQEFEIREVTAMQEVAKALVGRLPKGGLVLLTGELGAGKTTFVQALAKELGVTEPVTSPTFNVVQKYTTGHSSITQLIHADLYRLPDSVTEQEVAIQDVFEGIQAGTLVAVEWADKLEKTFAYAVTMKFSHSENPNERHVIVCFPAA